MPGKSKLIDPRLPRGFEDRGPADIAAMNAMIEKIRGVYERYGFDPVETPFFEYTEAQLRREIRLRKEARTVRPWWKWILFSPLLAIRWCWRAITPEGAKKFAYLCAGLLLVVAIVTPIQQQIALSELRQAARDRAGRRALIARPAPASSRPPSLSSSRSPAAGSSRRRARASP